MLLVNPNSRKYITDRLISVCNILEREELYEPFKKLFKNNPVGAIEVSQHEYQLYNCLYDIAEAKYTIIHRKKIIEKIMNK
jgi:hypothetical protein